MRRRVVLEDAAALVRAIVDDGRFRPVVVCPLPALAADLQAAAGSPLEFVDYGGGKVHPRGTAAAQERASSAAHGTLRQFWTLRFLVSLARLVRSRLRFADLFRATPPAAVIVFEDRAPHPEMVFLAQARRHGARAVLVSFAASSVESDVAARRDRPEHLVDVPPWRPIKRWLARRYPAQVRDTPSGRMLFFSAPESLALAMCGLLDGRNWHYGGGAIDVCAKLSAADLEHARAEGAPVERFIVAGQPMLDDLYRARTRAAGIRAELEARYALAPGKPLLVCAVPHNAEHGLVDWATHMELSAALFEALGRSGANVLLSLHPKSSAATYAERAQAAGCRLMNERLSAVLPAADLFVASYSSTVRWALLMGIPTIMADLLRLEYRQFAGLPGTRVERDAAGLEQTLRRLVSDAGERERMGRDAASGADRDGFDGKACARIVAALERNG